MLEDIILERKKKLEYLKEEKIEAYPVESKRTVVIADVVNQFSLFSKSKKKFFVTGRIRNLRDQGKIIFADVEDFSGRIQVILKKDELKNFTGLKKTLDMGDFIEVSGKTFLTNTKQKSVAAISVKILVKSLRSLPSDFYGLENIETRLRKNLNVFVPTGSVEAIFFLLVSASPKNAAATRTRAGWSFVRNKAPAIRAIIQSLMFLKFFCPNR